MLSNIRERMSFCGCRNMLSCFRDEAPKALPKFSPLNRPNKLPSILHTLALMFVGSRIFLSDLRGLPNLCLCQA